jgi:hypothetical protein
LLTAGTQKDFYLYKKMSEYEVHHHLSKTVADNKNTTLNKGWAGKNNFCF